MLLKRCGWTNFQGKKEKDKNKEKKDNNKEKDNNKVDAFCIFMAPGIRQ